MVHTPYYWDSRASTSNETRRANSFDENTIHVHDPFAIHHSQDIPFSYTAANVRTPQQYPSSYPNSPFPAIPNTALYGPSDASGTSFMTSPDPFNYMTSAFASSPQQLPSAFPPLSIASPGTSSGGEGSPPSTCGSADPAPPGYYRCECGSVLSMLNKSKNHATHEKSSKHRKALGLPNYQSEGLFCRWCEKKYSRHDACNRHQKNCPKRPGGRGNKKQVSRKKARSASVEREQDQSHEWAQEQQQHSSALAPPTTGSPSSINSLSPPSLPSGSRLLLSPSGIPMLPQGGYVDASAAGPLRTSPVSFHTQDVYDGSFYSTPSLSRSVRTTPEYSGSASRLAPSLDHSDLFLTGPAPSSSTFPGSWDSQLSFPAPLDFGNQLQSMPVAFDPSMSLPSLPTGQAFDAAWRDDGDDGGFGSAIRSMGYMTSTPTYPTTDYRLGHAANVNVSRSSSSNEKLADMSSRPP